MNNTQISALFRELADLLIQKKENWFKIRSYRKVADEIDKVTVDLATLSKENRLRQIPGVGEAIEKKIEEILTTGKLGLIDRIKTEITEGVVEKSRK
jgi:DNA polymerase (family 10)